MLTAITYVGLYNSIAFSVQRPLLQIQKVLFLK